MGVAHSGRNNDHLVDLLLESEGIKSSNVELAMRFVVVVVSVLPTCL